MKTIRRYNPRKQGEIGLGAAIAWFSSNGYGVSIPLADNQPYDLVVEDEEGLKRVQVKTTTHRKPRGNFGVALRTNGGNKSRHTHKLFDVRTCELLFVLTDDGRRYLFPTAELKPRTELTLGPRYDCYVVGEGFEPS
ncbi:hypothetical protein BH24ACT15_BH24ACT15_07800 [soil metagenome]